MRYRTIVADPPWEYDEGTGASYSSAGRRDCDLPYPTMTIAQIAALPVNELAEPAATLFLWTTSRYLRDAFDIVRAWRFSYVCTLVWCKQRGLGSGGVFYSNVEFVLYCRRGRTSSSARLKSRWFDWPRSEHSAKPPALQDIAEQVGERPLLELFARSQRLGWDSWGNEALNHVEIPQ